MADSNINIEITEDTPISIEIVEDTPVQLEITTSGPQGDPGVVQSIVAGSNVTVNSSDPANPIVSATGGGGGGGMQIGDEVVNAEPNRALFTDENGDLIDDILESQEISFFGGLLSGKAVRPTNFVHPDSISLGGVDATDFGGFETFGVIQSKARDGGLAYIKVDYDNLDTVPPDSMFLVGFNAANGKAVMQFWPEGQITNPTPFLEMDDTGITIDGGQKFNEVVTELTGATDLQIPTAKAVADAIGSPVWGSITGTLSNQTDLQTALNKRMRFIGTYSYGSDQINFYDGSPGQDIDTYLANVGDLLRIRTRGSKDFGLGTVYGEVNDFLIYDGTNWRPIYNPTRIALSNNDALVATGAGNQIQTLDTGSYPSLTEISYVKGVTSAIQTQINAKKTDSMATNKLLGRGTSGTGVIEEITLGTGLSLSGTTLNSSGGSVATDTIWDAKGDTVVATGADTAVRLAVGSDGQVIVANSNDTNGLRYARQHWGHLLSSGFYTPSHSWTTSSGASQNQNRTWYLPILINKRTTFDRVAVGHSSNVGSAGSVVRLGIYSNHATEDKPDALITEFGTIPTDTAAAFKSLTINQTLEPGLYWLAFNSQYVGTPTPQFSSGVPSMGMPTNATSATVLFFFENSISGSLPASSSAGGAAGASNGPIVWLRKA